ncbi:hypothetical protein QQZ08_006880 [Neonectria magnoliae]|uniref:Cytochrome P450 n=1 Tax=Neonectria magnoliae TaxID=2732573 RepID=A0ABR1HZW3_9HYPO
MQLPHLFALICLFVPIWAVLYWIVPHFTTYRHLKHIPGPFVSKFSNIWLALGARRGQKFAWVDSAHRKYGKVVRVGFNHVSIATPEGLRTVYAHGNGFLKDAFVSGVPGVFNVRHRGEHTRKRKIIAHTFSPGAVQDFESHMADNLRRWVAQLDRIVAYPGPDGFARINMMPWCTFLAFDIIGDLAFGAPFGMVDRGRDECESTLPGKPKTYVPEAETLNRRGEVNSTLSLLPKIRPFAKYLPDPFFSKGLQSVTNLHGIAEAAVTKRLEGSEKETLTERRRHDILDMLCRGKDGDGNPMPKGRAGLRGPHPTHRGQRHCIQHSLCRGVLNLPGLQAELDAAIPADSLIASHSMVKNLRFLRQCIDEGMRLHSTSAIGLPRIVTAARGVPTTTITSPKALSFLFPATPSITTQTSGDPMSRSFSPTAGSR